MNNLYKRSITGFIYVLVMLAGVAVHPLLFAITFASLLFFTQREFYNLMKEGLNPARKITGLAMGVMLFAVCFGIAYGLIPVKSYLIFIPALIFIFLFDIFKNNSKLVQSSAITYTGFIYVAVPFSLMNFIVFPEFPDNSIFYPWILIGILFIIWVYDSMAYLAGSLFGRHKMHERISPQKTWEGLITGTVFALIMGLLNTVIFSFNSIYQWIIIAIIVVIFGTLGDMFESKIKRKLKIKDSGKVLPGHGGLLDRLDSLLFIIPVVYVWLTLSGNI